MFISKLDGRAMGMFWRGLSFAVEWYQLSMIMILVLIYVTNTHIQYSQTWFIAKQVSVSMLLTHGFNLHIL